MKKQEIEFKDEDLQYESLDGKKLYYINGEYIYVFPEKVKMDDFDKALKKMLCHKKK